MFLSSRLWSFSSSSSFSSSRIQSLSLLRRASSSLSPSPLSLSPSSLSSSRIQSLSLLRRASSSLSSSPFSSLSSPFLSPLSSSLIPSSPLSSSLIPSSPLSSPFFLSPFSSVSSSEENEEKEKREEEKREEKEKVLLIDVSCIVYRGYHATKEGVKSHPALKSFIKSTLKLLKDFKPTHLGFVFDSQKNWRKDIDFDYKANRKKQEDRLRDDWPHIKKVIEVFGGKEIEIEGFEADDTIASLCQSSANLHYDIVIASNDKDFCQLINERVKIYNPQKKIMIDEKYVKQEYKIPPFLFSDYLALVGDAADGISKVNKITKNRLVELLQQSGGVENLLSLAEKEQELENSNVNLTPKEKDLLDPQQIRHHKNLTTLRTDGDVSILDLKWDRIKRGEWELFKKEYELTAIYPENSLFDQGNEFCDDGIPVLDEDTEWDPIGIPFEEHGLTPPDRVTIVQTAEKAREVVQQLRTLKKPYHAVDTEVIDIDVKKQSPVYNGKVICLSIFCGDDVNFGNGPLLWVDTTCQGVLEEFKPYFSDPEIKKVFHHYSFDYHVLTNHGIEVKGFGGDTMHMARLWDASRLRYSLEALTHDCLEKKFHKIPISKLFGYHSRKKDGGVRKAIEIPPIMELQQNPNYIEKWIDYSVSDAEVTWHLRDQLQKELCELQWVGKKDSQFTQWDLYQTYWLPFGQVLVDMERDGFHINVEYLENAKEKALQHRDDFQQHFISWATKYSPDCLYMNPNSEAQLRQLFFAPFTTKTGDVHEQSTVFTVDNEEIENEPSSNLKVKKKRKIEINGLGLKPISFTPTGLPQCNQAVLRKLAGPDPTGDPPVLGEAAKHWRKNPEGGKEVSIAIHNLIQMLQVNTVLSSFIIPLPQLADKNSRVHASLNLNTETGRLSCRNPNLQNQPSLERDVYKIRNAFCTPPGKTLIVADYSQLELRILAHVTKCQSMIAAFQQGGDFHSRTAMGMYPQIEEAVKNQTVLLEWDTTKGAPPAPLLKEKYKLERNRAKVLNFSIAYGKTPHGLANDFGVSVNEASNILERWYSDRPEVKDWQQKTIARAQKYEYVPTLIGRHRHLPDINSTVQKKKKHSERVAINTPIQGGAADIVVQAMILLHKSERLKEMNWRQILQIHDEVVLEGPEESAEEALQIVLSIMEQPFSKPLLVPLQADASITDTWSK